MSGVMDTRSKLWLAKLEPTEGTDSSPVVGTDDLCCFSDSAGISVGQEVQQIRPASPGGQVTQTLVTQRSPTASFRLPLYGLGLDGGAPDTIVLPQWVDTLLATVCSVSIGSADSTSAAVTLTPNNPVTVDNADSSTANDQSVTLYEYAGLNGTEAAGTKLITTMVGARLRSFTFTFAVGEAASLMTEFVGIVTQPDGVTTDISGADIDGFLEDAIVPNALAVQLTPNGGSAIDVNCSRLEISVDLGSDYVRSLGTDSGGTACIALGSPTVSISIDPLLDPTDIDAWWDANWAQDYFALSTTAIFPATRSTGTGYGVSIAADRVRLTGERDLSQNATRLSLEGTLTPSTISGVPFTVTLD